LRFENFIGCIISESFVPVCVTLREHIEWKDKTRFFRDSKIKKQLCQRVHPSSLRKYQKQLLFPRDTLAELIFIMLDFVSFWHVYLYFVFCGDCQTYRGVTVDTMPGMKKKRNN
jgi:hypothetical protein